MAPALVWIGLAAALPAVAIASPASPGSASPAAVPTSSQRQSVESSVPGGGVAEPPARGRGSLTARIVAPTFARRRLKSRRPGTRLATATSWSSHSQVLLVLRGARYRGRDWVRLRLPDRPNRAAAWVPRDRVVLAENSWWIDVLRGARKLVVRRAGRVVRRFSVVVGAGATPTPTGLAAIYEKNRQPDPGQFLGTWSLPLTLHSPVLRDYGGGPGRVAIHGRAGASLLDPLGTARSHGCIRVPDREAIWLAARIPPGTPVMIHP